MNIYDMGIDGLWLVLNSGWSLNLSEFQCDTLLALTIGGWLFAMLAVLLSLPTYRKVGGLHFVRWFRLQLSFCIIRNKAYN